MALTHFRLPQALTTRQAAVVLLFVLAAAFGLRYRWALTHPVTSLRADALQYDRLARHLLRGQGYTSDGQTPFVRRVPVYPLFLAGVYKVFGYKVRAVLLVQAGLGALAAGLTYLIGRRIFGDWPGLLGALLYAIYVPANSIFALVLSEALYIPLLALVILMLTYALERRAVWRGALIGLLTGVGALCRPVAIGFPAFAMAGIVWVQRGSRRAFVAASILFVCFGFIIAAWMAYNYVRTGGEIVFQSAGGRAMMMGTSAENRVELKKNPEILDADPAPFSSAFGLILADPLGYLRYCLVKVGVLYGPADVPPPWMPLYIFQLVFGVVGMVAMLPRWRRALPLYLVLGYITLFHSLSHAIPRYAVPGAPYWFLFAAGGATLSLSWLLARLKRRAPQSPA